MAVKGITLLSIDSQFTFVWRSGDALGPVGTRQKIWLPHQSLCIKIYEVFFFSFLAIFFQEENMVVKGLTQLRIDSQFTSAWRSGETFAWIRHLTTSVWPFFDACINAVRPSCYTKRNDKKPVGIWKEILLSHLSFCSK